MATGVNREAGDGRARSGDLRGDGDFRKLWAALSSSLLGSEITLLALPLLAALTLGASPVQMGLLAAAGQLPFLLVSLPAGIWVDRARRRPILIATDLGCALLLLSVPLAAALGRLGFAQLCLVAFGVGTLAALGEIAHYAYVPSLVGRAGLVEANSRIQISHSAANSVGPGIAGVLVQVLSAPVAVLLDAASFLVSAGLLRAINRPEPPPARPDRAEPAGRAIVAGLRALLDHPLLRPIILSSIAAALCLGGLEALFVLYATRELGLGPATLGLIFAIGGLCAIPGAILARWAARRWGVGPAILGGWTLEAGAAILIPLAGGPVWAIIATLAASRALGGLVGTVANIHQWSLRQAVTPDALQGRVTASHRFLVYGSGAIGAILGGLLGAGLGLRPALLVCALGMVLARLAALPSPLRRLRESPTRADAPSPVA